MYNNTESEQFGRRQALRRIALGAAGAAAMAIPSTISAEEPHWADKFDWVSPLEGIPAGATNPEKNLGVFDVVLAPGQTGVGVFSQFAHESIDPMLDPEGKAHKLFVKGKEGIPTVVVVMGHPTQETRVHFTEMPVKGGWFGVISTPVSSDDQYREAMRVRIAKLRDPQLNNCVKAVGCQGVIEYVLFDGPANKAVDHGFRTR